MKIGLIKVHPGLIQKIQKINYIKLNQNLNFFSLIIITFYCGDY